MKPKWILAGVLLCSFASLAYARHRTTRPKWVEYNRDFRSLYQSATTGRGRYLFLEVRDVHGRIRQVLLGDADWQGRRPGEEAGKRIVEDHEIVVRYMNVGEVLYAYTAVQ